MIVSSRIMALCSRVSEVTVTPIREQELARLIQEQAIDAKTWRIRPTKEAARWLRDQQSDRRHVRLQHADY